MKLYSNYFHNNANDLVQKISKQFDKKPYLSNELYKKQTEIVVDYIKKRNLKIYGGVAIDKHLPDGEKIYDETTNTQIIDFDIYTPTPRSDAVELGNLLFNAGFEYVNVQEGVNKGVYKVFNYFQEVTDFVFVPYKIYQMIPTNKINDMLYADPKHLKIDLLVSLTNPKYSNYRWTKDNERLLLLEKNHPIEKPRNFMQNNYYKKNTYYLEKIIRNFINQQRDNYVVIGNLAYTAYMEESNIRDYYKPVIKYIEIGMKNPMNAINELKRICKNNISVRKYHQFLKHIPPRYIITPKGQDNTILLIIYDLSQKSIPYVTSNGEKIQSFHSLCLFYYFMIYLSGCYNINFQKESSKCCLYELNRARKYYFSQNKTNQYKNNIFRDFVTDFVGEEIDVYKQSKINAFNRVKKFIYTPGKRQYLVESSKVGAGITKFISGEFDKEI